MLDQENGLVYNEEQEGDGEMVDWVGEMTD